MREIRKSKVKVRSPRYSLCYSAASSRQHFRCDKGKYWEYQYGTRSLIKNIAVYPILWTLCNELQIRNGDDLAQMDQQDGRSRSRYDRLPVHREEKVV